jgi:hypothetical protein
MVGRGVVKLVLNEINDVMVGVETEVQREREKFATLLTADGYLW